MVFCNNCGTKLKEGASFCGECGTVVTKPKPSATPSVTSTNEQPVTNTVQSPNRSTNRPQPASKPMSKKAKILTGIVATVAILLIGSYYFISHMFAPQSVANGFLDAIEEEDVQKVKEYVTEGQRGLSVNDDQVKSYINYLLEDTRVLSDISDQLNRDVELLESDTLPVVGNDKDSTTVKLVQMGKKWFIFDHYVVQVEPMYVNINSTEDNTDIMIGNEKLATVSSDKKKTIGPLLPGEYEIKAVVNGEYGAVEQVKEINFSEEYSPELNVDFIWSDFYVELYHWYGDEAILFVNGKSTDQTVEEVDMLGPILKDGSVKVSIQMGTQKSKEVPIKKGMDYYEFPLDDIGMNDEEMEEESTKESPDESSDEKSTSKSSDTRSEEAAIISAIHGHYDGITKRNYTGAYDYFSSSRKSKVTLSGWEKGFEKTIGDEVKVINVTSVDGDSAKAYIEMTSYDDEGDGTVLVQEWGGYWNLIKENGAWKLDVPDLEKLDSRIE